MTGLSALNLPQPLVWILAFAIIFGLLAAFAHLMKRIAGGRAAELEGGRNRVPRLGLVDSFDLDRHRKLLIVRRDNVEHLILVGPSDVVVESNIVRAASAPPLREERQAPVQAQPNVTAAPSAPIAQPAMPPAPPIPATPQMMQAPAAPAPIMPTAPFPVPQPIRPVEARKSTMPPPPPFGAPKRSGANPPQRIEPVLTAIAGGAPPADKRASDTQTSNAEPIMAPQRDLIMEPKKAETAEPAAPQSDEKPAPAPAPAPVLDTKQEPEVAPKPDLSTKPIADDPLLADLSAKLQDVLKANLKPSIEPAPSPARAAPPASEEAAAMARSPLPPLPNLPLPNLPPLPPKADMPPAAATMPPEAKLPPAPAPMAATSGMTQATPQESRQQSPQGSPPASPQPAPPPPPVDAFEEELRRILGRAPQKG